VKTGISTEEFANKVEQKHWDKITGLWCEHFGGEQGSWSLTEDRLKASLRNYGRAELQFGSSRLWFKRNAFGELEIECDHGKEEAKKQSKQFEEKLLAYLRQEFKK